MRHREDWEIDKKEDRRKTRRQEKEIDKSQIASELTSAEQKKAKIRRINIVILLIIAAGCLLVAYKHSKSAVTNIKTDTEILGLVSYGRCIEFDEPWAEYYTRDYDKKVTGKIKYYLDGGALAELDINPYYPIIHNTNLKEGIYLDVWIETRKRFMGLVKFYKNTVHTDYIINTWKVEEDKEFGSGILYITGTKEKAEERIAKKLEEMEKSNSLEVDDTDEVTEEPTEEEPTGEEPTGEEPTEEEME